MTAQLKSRCPRCQTLIKVAEANVGKRVRCPTCKQPFEASCVDLALVGSPSLDRAPVASETMEVAGTDTHPVSGGAVSAIRDRRAKPLERLGRFELRELLGQGGFGRVYRAYDPRLERYVALKVPTFGPGEKHKMQRFAAEAKAAASLRHPNIVPTYESGQIDGQYFIATQFVKGWTLAARIKDEAIEFRQAAEWVRQLADALSYAHGEGIVHRDIKPDNIMLDEKNVPQIMDFGLAKRLNDDSAMTTDGSILGTPAYMSPEQASGRLSEIGPPSDQYSLGVVLYELLTGNKPFQGSPHAVIAQVVSQEPPSPASLRGDVPSDLESICQKAMSKRAAERYSTCSELAADLARWLGGFETQALPIGWGERSVRWARRNPLVAALAAAVAVVTLLGLAGMSVGFARASYASSIAEHRRADAERARKLAEEEQGRAQREADRAQREAERAQSETERARQATELATSEAARAKAAESDATQRLWRSYIDQAHAGRTSRQLGQRLSSLKALAAAAKIRPTIDVRDEAIACLGLIDVDVQAGLPPVPLDKRYAVRIGTLTATASSSGRVATANGSVVAIKSPADGKTLTLNHSQRVETVLWRPDERFLAVGCADTGVYIWQADSGQLQNVLDCDASVPDVAFSPDGQLLLTWSWDGHGRLWDPVSGMLLLESEQGKVMGSFSSDGKFIDNPGQRLPLVGGLECRTLHHGEVGNRGRVSAGNARIYDLAFTHDSRFLCTAGLDGSRIWEIASGRELAYFPDAIGKGAVFLPDGDLCAVGKRGLVRYRFQEGDGDSPSAWSAGDVVVAPPEGGLIENDVSIDAAGQWAAFCEPKQQRARLIELGNPQSARLLGPQAPNCWCSALSPDARWVATSAWAWQPPPQLNVWNAQTGNLHFSTGDDAYASVRFSPDGQWLLCGSKTAYVLRSTRDWQIVRSIPRRSHLPGHLSFSQDFRWVVLMPNDYEASLYETSSWQRLANFSLPGKRSIHRLQLSNDGRWLALAAAVDALYLWDIHAVRAQLRGIGLDWNDPPGVDTTDLADQP